MIATKEVKGTTIIVASTHGEKYVGLVVSEDLVEGQDTEERIRRTAHEQGFIKLRGARQIFERIGVISGEGNKGNIGIVRNITLFTIDINVKPEDNLNVAPSVFRIVDDESLKTLGILEKEAERNEVEARAQKAGIELPNNIAGTDGRRFRG